MKTFINWCGYAAGCFVSWWALDTDLGYAVGCAIGAGSFSVISHILNKHLT